MPCILDVSLNSQVYLQRIEGQHQLNQYSIAELICFSSHAYYGPYRNLIKVFNALPQQRSALILQYLEEWYQASRREPYYDQHPQTRSKIGSRLLILWEAAAITWLMDIEDMSYREHQFYPKDLVDFAQAQSNFVQVIDS